MNDYTKNAIEYAFNGNISDMQKSIEDALNQKIIDALAQQKIEVSKTIFTSQNEDTLLSKIKEDLEVLSKKTFKEKYECSKKKAKKWIKEGAIGDLSEGLKTCIKKCKEGEEEEPEHESEEDESNDDCNESITEKLEGKMSASEVINDFVHSTDPKFKGKSKAERIKMALGAFYGMHPELKKEDLSEESYEIKDSIPGKIFKKKIKQSK